MPSHFPGEGQYICHIRKPGVSKKTIFKNDNRTKYQVANSYKESDFKMFGDTLFALSNSFDTKWLKVIRYGVKVCTETKGIVRYDLHYARTLKKDDMPTVELNTEQLKDYLVGNQKT